MWKYLVVVAVAIVLGTVPPLLAAVDLGLLLPDSDMFMLALALLVIALPYLLIFLLVWPAPLALRHRHGR